MSTVRWAIGTTINIGDYSNVKYEVEVTDSTREGESVKDASKRIAEFVETELDAKITETKEELAESVKEVTDMAKRLTGK